jgi:hypothetical protein
MGQEYPPPTDPGWPPPPEDEVRVVRRQTGMRRAALAASVLAAVAGFAGYALPAGVLAAIAALLLLVIELQPAPHRPPHRK